MIQPLRRNLSAISAFLDTPGLGRRVVGLVGLALALLLVVNVATFVMIQRTAAFNDEVERSQAVRRAARSLLIAMIDAETGQRGYLLTDSEDFLTVHKEALARTPGHLADLSTLVAGDEELAAGAGRLADLVVAKVREMGVTIDLAAAGRSEDAARLVTQGQGKALMDAIRAEAVAIDRIEGDRQLVATQRSEQGAAATVWINAVAGALIVVLAIVVGWLVHRYIADVRAAQRDLDQLNAGLENEVRDRTTALTRANEEIQRFAYIVSHDLRAPLVNVMGYTAELEAAGKVIDRQMTVVETTAPGLVESDALTAVREDMPEAVGFIRASTEKMDRLINAILRLSREGRRNLTPERLDLGRLAQGIADSVNHQTGAQGAEIEVGSLPEVESDRLTVEQILGNLVDNAIKYLDPARPGRIRIEGETRGDGSAAIRVVDNGRGVAERDLERIFELFRRAGKQDRPGEGLGLAFVRNSARRLGGEVTVESRLGEGSTFCLILPRRLSPTAGESA